MKKAVILILVVSLLLVLMWIILLSTPTGKCDSVSNKIIDKYGIQKLAGCISEKFEVDGREVYVVKIGMGPPSDCPSGCIYNRFITIVEGEADYPYLLDLTSWSEEKDCVQNCTAVNSANILNLTSHEAFSGVSDKFTGSEHWFAKTQEFRELARRFNFYIQSG